MDQWQRLVVDGEEMADNPVHAVAGGLRLYERLGLRQSGSVEPNDLVDHAGLMPKHGYLSIRV
jgi:hypothetical protein